MTPERLRPTRHPRIKFTSCDTGRVAINAEKGGADPNEILRCVHKALGYEFYTIKRPKRPRVIDEVRKVANSIVSQTDGGQFAGLVRSLGLEVTALSEDVVTAAAAQEVGVGVGLVQTSLDVLASFLARIYVLPLIGVVTALGIATATDFLLEKLEGDYDIVKTDTGKRDDPRNCKCNFNGGSHGNKTKVVDRKSKKTARARSKAG